MAENSKIAWTDSTFNPWIGCTKVGPGCDHCYAESYAKRVGKAVWGNDAPRQLTKGPWRDVLKWQRDAGKFFAEHGRKRRVFCASLADVFDNQVIADWRWQLWETMESCPDLNFQIVTKRIGNLPKMVPHHWQNGGWPSNVGVMSTIVNQEEADRDIPKLLKAKEDLGIPWVGLSMEPLLGPVHLGYLGWPKEGNTARRTGMSALTGAVYENGNYMHSLPKLDWIIVGGESGPKWRKMRFEWAYDLLGQARAVCTPYFFKQVSELHPTDAMIESELRVREYPVALR